MLPTRNSHWVEKNNCEKTGGKKLKSFRKKRPERVGYCSNTEQEKQKRKQKKKSCKWRKRKERIGREKYERGAGQLGN